MEKDSNEILFNNLRNRGLVKKNSSEAKKLFQLLLEHESQERVKPEAIINLYTNKIQTSKKLIENKLEEDKLRPFEFYIIQN